MKFSEGHERLMELIGLVRDGGLDDAQAIELESMLENDPQGRAYYVESIDMIAMLHRQQGLVPEVADDGDIRPVTLARTSTRSGRWSMVGWSVAICGSLAIGVLMGRLLLPSPDVQTSGVITANLVSSHEAPEVATLSSSSGCRWDPRDESRYEGQRLASESLRLIAGVAVVHFDCDVDLILEGPAQLDLASFDHAMLRYGKAVFSGDGDLDPFTLETPFSKIQDDGTEYAVSVDPQSNVEEVHVFDGHVTCNTIDRSPLGDSSTALELDAGQARRFDGQHAIKTIPMDPSRFIREPRLKATADDATLAAESFAYDRSALVGQQGGTGWLDSWVQPTRFETRQNATVRIGESLSWPVGSASPSDGSLILEGGTGLHRTLETPIRMDRNATYYLSFLIRKHAAADAAKSNGWAYVTLRDPKTEAEKIAIGPTSARGNPRVVHKGRAVNATSPLRDDVVYLFVCKIQARKNKEDQVLVRIYGDHESVDSVEPSAWSVTTRPIRDDSVLSELRLYSQNSVPLQLDNFRIGKTWSSVTSQYLE